MKILFNRISNRISGAEMYNVYLLDALKKYTDLDITFSSDNEVLNRRIKSVGIKTKLIQPGINEIGTKKQFLHACILSPIFFLRYLNLLTSLEKFDCIVFESMTEKLFLTLVLCIFRYKVLWIEHGSLYATQRASIIKWLYKFNSLFVEKIICVSKSTASDLTTNGINLHKTVVVYIGIDTEKFAPANQKVVLQMKNKLGIKATNVIGLLGTVTREKGIIDFLDTVGIVSQDKRDIEFLVIGEGNMLEWAKNKVKKENLKNVHFTGFVEDVKEYLSVVDVMVFPTHHQEGVSIALLEAGSMGIPVVARDIGGNNEIIRNGWNGYLFDNSSPVVLQKLIYKALAHKENLKEHAEKIVTEKFSEKVCAMNFYKLFQTI